MSGDWAGREIPQNDTHGKLSNSTHVQYYRTLIANRQTGFGEPVFPNRTRNAAPRVRRETSKLPWIISGNNSSGWAGLCELCADNATSVRLVFCTGAEFFQTTLRCVELFFRLKPEFHRTGEW
jgi:hypothetical protein